MCDHLEDPQERRARAEAHGNETARGMEDEGDQKLCVNRAASQKLRSQQRSRLSKNSLCPYLERQVQPGGHWGRHGDGLDQQHHTQIPTNPKFGKQSDCRHRG